MLRGQRQSQQQQQQQQQRSYGSMVDTTIHNLQRLGINLLAIDFDQTILDCHTGGRWTGTVDELSSHVRSEFRQLLNACCDTHVHAQASLPTIPNGIETTDDDRNASSSSQQRPIFIAIVTFSAQVKIVRGVIENIVGLESASRIPIRGADRTWSYDGEGCQERKQPFIASAVEELIHHYPHIDITKNTTVLIDDDRKNIRCAIHDGVRAIWFNPEKPHRILQDLRKLE